MEEEEEEEIGWALFIIQFYGHAHLMKLSVGAELWVSGWVGGREQRARYCRG